MPDTELDQILYEAYREAAGWKSAITGATLPPWSECSVFVRNCWAAAAQAAQAYLSEQVE